MDASAVCDLIESGQHAAARERLALRLEAHPKCDSTLMASAHVLQALGDFTGAAHALARAIEQQPERAALEGRNLQLARCYRSAGQLGQALAACHAAASAAPTPDAALAARLLQAEILCASGDCAGAAALLAPPTPAAARHAARGQPHGTLLAAQGCAAYRGGRYTDAREAFQAALDAEAPGHAPQLAYAVAACHYHEHAYAAAARGADGVVERALRAQPRSDAASDGRWESLNLRAAVHFECQRVHAASASLAQLPATDDPLLRAIGEHNAAVVGMESDAVTGLATLRDVASSPHAPPEALGNLLLMYLRYGFRELAADVLAENAGLAQRNLPPDLFAFLHASVAEPQSDEAASEFDALVAAQLAAVRSAAAGARAAHATRDVEGARTAAREQAEAAAALLPYTLAHAAVYWGRADYAGAERCLLATRDVCAEAEAWRLAIGHACFMQERHEDAAGFYEPIVHARGDALLSVSPSVVANLCVCHVMLGRNEAAEALIARLEAAEEAAGQRAEPLPDGSPAPPPTRMHLCVVNLAVGTLYCARSNASFGVRRVVKALTPLDARLTPDTWYYVKRCLLAVAEGVAKRVAPPLDDDVARELGAFLAGVDAHERRAGAAAAADAAAASVSGEGVGDDVEVEECDADMRREARTLRRLFMLVREW